MNKLPLAGLPLLVLLAACATPQARIEANPGVYASLSAEQQDLVKKGEVGLGMPQAAVELALGKPDHVTEHTDAGGTNQVWHYTRLEYWGPLQPYPYWYPYPRLYDPGISGNPGVYPPYPQQIERDRLRLVFDRDGKVGSIERED